jgi:hypothetical protein
MIRFFKKLSFPFSLLLFLHILYFFYLTTTLRIPAGHDGFQYFTLQYYFLNHAVSYGEIPHWMPFMTMGTVAGWWYSIQAGFVQSALLLVAGLLHKINFINCFHAGMFFDELVLLAGCWLFGRRYLDDDWSVFFFCVSGMGSSLWLSQPWFGFHFYYCLPLILHFGHSFVETGKWRFFVGASQLLLIQAMGNLPYFLPFMSFVVFLYFFLFFVFNLDVLKNFLNKTRFGITPVCLILAAAGTCLLIFLVTTSGTDQIVNYNLAREPDGSTTLENFLSYAGGLNLNKWKELALGVSPELNYNLYGGVLILPLTVWTLLFRFNRKIMPVVLLIVCLLDFSTGGISAVLAYKAWPLMNYYRHLFLVSPIIKIFIFLVASYAFDKFLILSIRADSRLTRIALCCPSAVLIILWLWHSLIPRSVEIVPLIVGMIPEGRQDLLFFAKRYIPGLFQRLYWQEWVMAISALLWGLRVFVPQTDIKRYVLIAILSVHVLDLGLFKFYESNLRSFSAVSVKAVVDFQKMPFGLKREGPDGWNNSPRSAFIHAMPLKDSVQYWSNDTFLFRDSAGHAFRTDHWLLPLDEFVRAYSAAAKGETVKSMAGNPTEQTLNFPLMAESARKISAIDRDKLQCFSDSLIFNSQDVLSSYLGSSRYVGDIPLMLNQNSKFLDLSGRLQEDARMKCSYLIENFSADRLDLTVTSDRAGWLLYSDVWHPQWQAQVNGREIEIKKANLAFKIIHINPGINHVNFLFNPPYIICFQVLLCLMSAAWIGIVLLITLRLVYPGFLKFENLPELFRR